MKSNVFLCSLITKVIYSNYPVGTGFDASDDMQMTSKCFNDVKESNETL